MCCCQLAAVLFWCCFVLCLVLVDIEISVYLIMCRPDASKKQNTNGNGVSSMLNCVVSISLLVYIIGFIFFRIGELVPLYYTYRLECIAAIIGSSILRFTLSSRVEKYMLHIVSLIALIYVLDHHAIKPLPDMNNELYTGKIVVITGGKDKNHFT